MAQSISTGGLVADNIPAEQKEHLREVASLMLTIYQTLVDMRYLDPNALIRGPHKLTEDLLAMYKECGLDPAIIYLYTILPYVDNAETNVRDFFQGGAFFNQMRPKDVQQGRDPCYIGSDGDFDDENGQYMYPWYTPLSNCGNHSSVIIYDARKHRIWVIDQIERDSTDPVFCMDWYNNEDEESSSDDSGDSNRSDASSDDDGEGAVADGGFDPEVSCGSEVENDHPIEAVEPDESAADQSEPVDYDEGFVHVQELSEGEGREAADTKNRNSLESVRNRPAGSVLSDINRWYRELKELPGQGEHTGWLEPKILRPLYSKNGWPNAFNGDQFEVDMARAHCAERAR